jgi:mannosylglycerate hydrolase
MLESHPHDSINGVTQDKTADDVEHRLKQALEIAQVVYDKAVAETLKRIDLSAYDSGDTLLVVFNPHPRPVREVIRGNHREPGSDRCI